MVDAITREKQIKAGSRKTKLALIEAQNPNWGRPLRHVDLTLEFVIARSASDEAIQTLSGAKNWIASLRSQ
jgi:hypothetical protein